MYIILQNNYKHKDTYTQVVTWPIMTSNVIKTSQMVQNKCGDTDRQTDRHGDLITLFFSLKECRVKTQIRTQMSMVSPCPPVSVHCKKDIYWTLNDNRDTRRHLTFKYFNFLQLTRPMWLPCKILMRDSHLGSEISCQNICQYHATLGKVNFLMDLKQQGGHKECSVLMLWG
jgi:hypothetical protein